VSETTDRAAELREQADQAMKWILRLRDSEVKDTTVLEWIAWYEASSDNRKAFDEMQGFWQFSGTLASSKRGSLWIEQMLRPSIWARLGHYGKSWIYNVDMAIRGRWSGASAAIVGLGAVALTAYLGVSLWERDGINRHGVLLDGDRRVPLVSTSRLSDGSSLELAPRTDVNVAYTQAERLLDMKGGEAHFTVAPNKNRPFIVHVSDLRVRAVGTQFDIRQAGNHVVVKVIEGKIDIYDEVHAGINGDSHVTEGIDGTSNVVHVTSGEQFTSFGGVHAGLLAASNSDEALSWRDGRLQYLAEPLGSVIADVNRYISRPIIIRDEGLKSLTYTGTIFIQSIDEWLSAVPKEFPVIVIAEANQTILAAATTSDPSIR
jgi:transmembrane sensor